MSANSFNVLGTASRFGNVTIGRNDNFVRVFLHGNEVVTIDNAKRQVKLSNCGWVTPTTHKTINNALKQIGVNLSVASYRGITLVHEGTKAPRQLVNGETFKF